MNKCAVLHIPLSEYAFARDEHTITVRIRTAKNDIRKCILWYGDRVDQEDPIHTWSLQMEKAASDSLFDYYTACIQDQFSRVCYYFELTDCQENTYYYYERGICSQIGENRTEFFQFPYIRREDVIRIPEWFSESVMYHIFPDSFANGKGVLIQKKIKEEEAPNVYCENRMGGTLKGIQDNLDYLTQMGINCIYLNPIFTANSYHKYDTIDYYKIDPCLGTNDDLKLLVRESHQHGIRVILDGVFNHCGADFFAFRDVLKKGELSKYYDWFYQMPLPVLYKDPPNYEAFAYVKEMPKLNTGNKMVQDYFCEVGKFWIKEADIDGWRLDVANEINHDFWRSFRKAVHSVKEDAVLIGEIWEDAGCWLGGDQFDSTMNYPFTYLCRDFFAKKKIGVMEFDAQIQKMLMRYPDQISNVQMNLLDSHDIPRFLSYCDGDIKKWKLAFLFLMTMVGMPSVFYGDECGIMGVSEAEYRSAMKWDCVEDELAQYVKNLVRLRRQSKVLQKGLYRSVFTDDSKELYIFKRILGEQEVIIIINNGDTKQSIPSVVFEKERYYDSTRKEKVNTQALVNEKEGLILF